MRLSGLECQHLCMMSYTEAGQVSGLGRRTPWEKHFNWGRFRKRLCNNFSLGVELYGFKLSE